MASVALEQDQLQQSALRLNSGYPSMRSLHAALAVNAKPNVLEKYKT
jgi:hypothetical protein